ncbi:hypothetical protein A7X93_00440 [Stenotrophomonas maltophilia]|jgi:hypothetical protein|uniref:hypothetical protein n=1 Tax=Stenotrophomonas TaxID=40323 RepID=UPI000DA8F6C1|nr:MULTISPECIES: hypothetical protein [Stenotrophomonas]MDH2023610.1 hypothetical protein [Stenotrophomonas sp. GD03680]MDI9249047.1 hypothetical protein [Stenotrophomonas sp. RS-48]PZT35109.1 hypothetical protein A7X93_00440 [Stenotrophomonas maltophilia]UQY97355.1 hypothetical protein LZ605_08335 [Stenotrophomonas maltophilia]HEL3751357.1 hypothetical protein [Stenotrophomonas maltophilia]
MSAVALFPIQTDSQKYQLETVRMAARRAGLNVKAVEREFIEAGFSRPKQNEISERCRRARMVMTFGGEA